MVCAAPRLRDSVINLEDAKWELGLTTVAQSFLLSKEDVLVLAVGDRDLYVRSAGNVGTGGDVAMVEQAPIACWRRM